ncbi:MAG: LysM peptidoglycan-binding domain-containing protein, partial [Planctomycetaceae bacterium]|nr:LysM peptidoglycan-binding domain-containing protein [Planctomycetaceae bacterium]
PTRSGLSRETKMGFAFVMVLLVVFGFVVYKKIEQGKAERGDLLAGVQEPPASPDGTTPDSVTPPAETPHSPESSLAENPPNQNFNQFPEPTPPPASSELTPASWDQQSFEPPPQTQVVNTPPTAAPGTSLEQFPRESQPVQEFAPPVETAAQFPQEPQYQVTSEPPNQTSTVAVQPVPEATEFAPPVVPGNETFTQSSSPETQVTPTPFPENEFAQAPVPQGFEPPTDLSNQPFPQEMPVTTPPTGGENMGGNPFAVGANPEQPEPASSAPTFENEQFATQSQPVPQEFGPPPVQEPAPTPATGNPFGDFAAQQSASPTPPAAQSVPIPPAVTGNDPFAPTGVATQAEPVPPPGQETFAPTEIAKSSPAESVEIFQPEQNVETFPADQTGQPIPEQAPPAMEFAQPNPLPIQSSEPKQLPIANNANFQDFEPVPTGTQFAPAPTEANTIVQLPVNPGPTELADNSFGPIPGALGSEETSRPSSAPANDGVQIYEVRPGDNYWKISKNQYGTVRYFSALARYNQKRIPDPKKMRPGMKVLTPTREVLEANNPDLFPKFAAKTADVSPVGHRADQPSGFYVDAQGRAMYRVGQNDTLGGIAHKHLGRFSRWTEIYQLNRHRLKDPNALTLGDVLILPSDASRVNMVQHASGVR